MRTVSCRCGEVGIGVEGEPFLAVACHCDDCQAGGRQLEAEPGAPAILDAGAGSPYVLFRRDRLRVLRGAENLKAHALKPESRTRRVIATCCATPMYVDVPVAHWVTAYRDAFLPGAPMEMRVMTRFAPEGRVPEDGAKAHKGAPAVFLARVAAAWIPMLLTRRPRLTWPPRNRPA